MRESLTIFAIAMIVVLSALLVGPHLVDWSRQRDWLSAKLSKAIGIQVRIDGPIDVELLPRPIFRAMQVSIGGAKPHDPRFTADRLDTELSINGLLQGTVEFVDIRAASPRLELTIGEDGGVVAPRFDVASPQKIQFRSLSIEDGTVAVLDMRGAERIAIHNIAAEGAAETLFGPLKLTGSSDGANGRVLFRLNTGALAGRKLRAGLVMDGKGDWTHAEAEGTVVFGVGPGQPPLAFDGNARLLGAFRIADGAAPVPWLISATGLTADPKTIAAPTLELRAGADSRAVVATGGALVGVEGPPSGVVKLRARQLDLDRIAVPPDVAPDTPRPSAQQWLAAVRRAVEGTSLPDMRLTADFGVDAVTAGDLTLTDAVLKVDTQPGAPPRLAAAIAGPEGTRLGIDGVVETGAAQTFRGRADVSTRNIATVAAWLDPFWPGLGDRVARDAQGRAFALHGAVDVSSIGVAARDATVTIGGSVLTGTMSLTTGVSTGRPRLFADVRAEGVDPEQWPGLRALQSAIEPMDLSIAMRSDSVRLTRADTDTVESGRLSLHLDKVDKSIKLDQFELVGFGGANVTATASLDADHRLLAEGRASAGDVTPLARFLRLFVPGGVADALSTHAAALSPLDLGFRVEAKLDDDAGVLPLSFSGSGTAGAARFNGTIAPALRGGDLGPVDVALTVDAPDAGEMLTFWGRPAASGFGVMHADLHASGTLAEGFDSQLSIATPVAKLTFDGRAAPDQGQGRIVASGSDSSQVLRAVGLAMAPADRAWSAQSGLSWSPSNVALRGVSARLGGSQIGGDLEAARATSAEGGGTPTVSGRLTIDAAGLSTFASLGLGSTAGAGKASGLWSNLAFGPAPVLPTGDVELRVGMLDLWPGVAARDAALTMSARSGGLTLAGIKGQALGGTISGSVILRRNGALGSISGRVAVDRLALALPNLSGRLSATLDLAGSGTTPAALVGSLAGDGTLRVDGATIARLDPKALGRVAADFNAEGAEIDDASVRDDLTRAFEGGMLGLGDIGASATIAAGALRVSSMRSALPDATVVSDAGLSLSDLNLTLRSTLTATALPRDWSGDPPAVTVTWKGPLKGPARDMDVGAFLNGLAARAIAREQDRIELMRDDLRERAFFARRLKQIEAEQRASRDAAQIQKMVPQPPRPGDIRLPKPPEVPAPSFAVKAKAADEATGQDAISRFLGANPPMPQAPGEPLSLAPAVR